MRQGHWSKTCIQAAGVAALGFSMGCDTTKNSLTQSTPRTASAAGMPIVDDIKIEKPRHRKPNARMVCDFADATLNGGNSRKAESFYRQALEIDRNCDRAYAGLGRVLMDQERTQAAMDLLKTGLERCPKSAPIWNEVGVAHAKRRDHANAIVALKNAVQYDPHSTLYKANLGNVLAMQGKIEEAYEHLSQTMPAADARFRIAGILFSAGQHDLSRRQLETALRMDPKNQPAAEMFEAMVAGRSSDEIERLAAGSMREDNQVQPAGYRN